MSEPADMLRLRRTRTLFCWIMGGSILVLATFPARSQPYAFDTLVGSVNNPGTADGTNSDAQFTSPEGLTVDAAGTLYVTDGNSIRSIVISGTNRVVRTLAGTIGNHAFIDGTNGTARLNSPQGIAADAAGNLYVADTFNNAIRKVTVSGTNWIVTTIAGPAPPATTFGTADGTNNTARFHNPYGIAVDAATNLYVADSVNQTIRKITPAGTNWVVTTLAGLGGFPGSADGSNEVARFSSPASVALDTNGAIYVADLANDTIRKITPIGANWAVTTLAGFPGLPGSVDGSGTNALFNSPQCVTLDSLQNLFVTDAGNFTVRKITPSGAVTTIAGSPGISAAADGIGSAASFVQPSGIAANTTGTVYVVDYLGYSIREGQVAAVLQFSISGKSLVLFWPSALAGFAPQTSANLSGGSWAPLPTNLIVLSDQYSYFTNPVGSGNTFFRLYKTGP